MTYKITPEVLEKAEAAAARGLTSEQIAECLGISKATLQRRNRDSEPFADAIKKGRAEGIRQVANSLFEQAISGNTAAAIFFLKTRAYWSEKSDSDKPSIDIEKLYNEVEKSNSENRKALAVGT